jgi:hypothetical protein
VLREISGQFVCDATFDRVTLTFGLFVDVDPRQPVAEFQLQPGSDAVRQVADLFQTRLFGPIQITNALIADASAVWRWTI